MHDEILQTIAKHTPYSYDQCRRTYNHCRSYDVLLVVLSLATATGSDPIELARRLPCWSS